MRKLVSIVLPVYNESDILSSFFDIVNKEVSKLSSQYDFEIIFVNDGSRDATRGVVQKLGSLYPIVKGINFSRNFGKEIAISAGLERAVGDCVITLDSDGQHPIEKIGDFLQEWENGFEIVYNKRPKNEGASFMKNITSKIFYSLFNSISDFKLEQGTTDYRLLDRKVVDSFGSFGEKNRLYRGLVDRLGFSKKALVFDAIPRMGDGKATYSYKKLRKLAMNSITSFSLYPLKLVGHFGLIVIIFSLVMIGIMLYNMFLQNNSMQFTNTSLLVIFSIFLSGLTLSSLGMIALYIANIHEEVMDRPLYVVKDSINLDSL